MSAFLYFVIPVRHHDTVRDWSVVMRNLSQTLGSISAQTHPGWACVLVASYGAELPPLPPNCEARFIDLPPPDLPDPRQGKKRYYDAIRRDKGLRIYEGMRELPPDVFIMPVDYDDFVSNRLAGFVAHNRSATGWFIPKGYLYSGGGWCYRTSCLHEFCGTSHILRRGVLGSFEGPDKQPDLTAIKRRLGSHIFNQSDLENTPDALTPLPFPGAVYRVGTPGSVSGADGVFHLMTSPRHILRRPVNTLRRLTRYRPMTAKIRQEFSLP